MILLTVVIHYLTFWTFLWGRGRQGEAAIIAIVAFVLYLVTNLIVLYVSRIREYYADYGGAELTGRPQALASALYRITLDTAKIDDRELKKVAGIRAFLATDPAHAQKDIFDLKQADLNMDGHLDSSEIMQFAQRSKVNRTDKLLELFSSHPHVVRRIKRLAALQ